MSRLVPLLASSDLEDRIIHLLGVRGVGTYAVDTEVIAGIISTNGGEPTNEEPGYRSADAVHINLYLLRESPVKNYGRMMANIMINYQRVQYQSQSTFVVDHTNEVLRPFFDVLHVMEGNNPDWRSTLPEVFITLNFTPSFTFFTYAVSLSYTLAAPN